MDNLDENLKLQFVSKLYTKGKTSFPTLRKFTVILICVYSVLVLTTYFMQGFSTIYILKHLITYLLCFFVMYITKPKNDYQNAIANVTFFPDNFSVNYGNPDDEAAYIPKTANVRIFYRNIVTFKYDALSQELFIKECSTDTNEEAFTIIYIPEEESKIFISYIQSNSENCTLPNLKKCI